MIHTTTKLIYIFSLFVLVTAGCTMKHIPAEATSTSTFCEIPISTCSFQSFPDSNNSLFPNIRLIDFEVDNELAPELVEFKFTHKNGGIYGAQSQREIEDVQFSTGEHGVLYFLNYIPRRGVQDSLGRWCCWDEQSVIAPEMDSFFPDELNAIHINSDGGIVYRASWNTKGEARGLAIILCGLGGMQQSSKTLGAELLKDDWAVVYLYTVLNIPEYNMKVQLRINDPITSAIEIFDTKYCQVIAATKAIRKRMSQQLPTLPNASLALIGISAGALNTPAVFHEMQDEVDAVVLVAGGANMFDIVQGGAFTNWKFTDLEGASFSSDELYAMNAKYLATPSRDPYFLAAELPHENTLLIHAKWDAVVPAKNGDLLWERAGKPERWIYPSGHLGLFMSFSWHTNDIVKWIDSKTTTSNEQLLKLLN